MRKKPSIVNVQSNLHEDVVNVSLNTSNSGILLIVVWDRLERKQSGIVYEAVPFCSEGDDS